MSWLSLTLTTTSAHIEGIEEALFAAGAVSVSLVSNQDEPVLEPAPGATPLWQQLQMVALLPLETDIATLRAGLTGTHGAGDLSVDFVAEDAWQTQTQNTAVELSFGERLLLRPKAQKPQRPNAVQAAVPTDEITTIYLEPGLAFGSGSHQTTAMCLAWLADHVEPGQRLLDFGCGSGVLGIAASLLGAHAVGVDYDPQAVMASLENAAYNDLQTHDTLVFDDQTFGVLSLEQWQALSPEYSAAAFDVVVANILAGPIRELAPVFEQVTRPGGKIVLSGILSEQADAVIASFTSTTFKRESMDEWVCLQGVKDDRHDQR